MGTTQIVVGPRRLGVPHSAVALESKPSRTVRSSLTGIVVEDVDKQVANNLVIGQATSHLVLRNKLLNITTTRRRTSNGAEFSWFSNRNSVAFFYFGMYSSPDGVAAKVLTERDDPLTTVPTGTFPVTQAKRDEEGLYFDSDEEGHNSTAPVTGHVWPEYFDYEATLRRIQAGHGTEDVILAYEDVADRGNQTDTDGEWDHDEENEYEGDYEAAELEEVRYRSTQKMSRDQPQPILKSIHERNFTPLLKRATPQNIQDAQAIIESAMAESGKLNMARLAKPLRNTYGLRPGTVVGGSAVTGANATTNQDVTPLLQLTDAIVEAAALIAETSAVSGIGNMTKRAVAATGTYWMGSITRQGTVPWGNDPAYKIFRNVIDYGAVGDGITVSRPLFGPLAMKF